MRELLVVHGGVDMPTSPDVLAALSAAARTSWAMAPIATAVVVAAVGSLESDPLFNAGYGSVLNIDGDVEVDAAIVDGKSGKVGAVAAVMGLRHPIRVAAALMASGQAVLLAGSGARQYADSLGEWNEDLRTADQSAVWKSFRDGQPLSQFTGGRLVPATETVGCIAFVGENLVAGSSTGGVCGKQKGRIGDSAILGSGIWADEHIAVLCSGDGEAIIRTQLAFRCSMEIHDGRPIADAVRWAVEFLSKTTNAVGAVVAMDRNSGEVAAAHNGADFPVVTYDGLALNQLIAECVVGAMR